MARKKSKKTLKVILISLAVITVVGFLSNASGLFGQAEETTEYIDPNENFSGWHLVNNVNQLKDGDNIVIVSDLFNCNYMMSDDYIINNYECQYEYNNLNDYGTFKINEFKSYVFKITLENDLFKFYSSNGYMTLVDFLGNYSYIHFTLEDENNTFNINFDNDYALISPASTNFYLAASESSFHFSDDLNTIKIFKWYGENDITLDINYSNYDGIYTFDEYELVDAKDYILDDGNVVCPIIKRDSFYYAPLNLGNGNCGDCNMIWKINFLGNGFALTDDLLSFYNVTYRGSDFYSLDSVSDSIYDPKHDDSYSILIKYYQYDYNTFRDNDYHSNYLTYNQSGVNLGELGFYYCPDNFTNSSNGNYISDKFCHFGSSSNSIDSSEYDTQNMHGIYGQITHWLVQKN